MDLYSPTYLLGVVVLGLLILLIFALLYTLRLRKELRNLTLVCSTDDKLRKVLLISDDLLGKLPQGDLEVFVASPNFELYKEVMEPIMSGKAPVYGEQKKITAPPKPSPASSTPAASKPAIPPVSKDIENLRKEVDALPKKTVPTPPTPKPEPNAAPKPAKPSIPAKAKNTEQKPVPKPAPKPVKKAAPAPKKKPAKRR